MFSGDNSSVDRFGPGFPDRVTYVRFDRGAGSSTSFALPTQAKKTEPGRSLIAQLPAMASQIESKVPCDRSQDRRQASPYRRGRRNGERDGEIGHRTAPSHDPKQRRLQTSLIPFQIQITLADGRLKTSKTA